MRRRKDTHSSGCRKTCGKSLKEDERSNHFQTLLKT